MLMGLLLFDAASKPAARGVGSGHRTFFDLVLAVWPLWVLVGLVALARLGVKLYRLRRLAKSGIREIDVMDGRTFEQFLATLFRRLGYRVENTRYRGDYGADLVVRKDGIKTAVQAKRWSKRVGVNAIQEAVASKGYYACDRALVVANREFTKQAHVLARANQVELWDREALVSRLLAVHRRDKQRALNAELTPVSPETASDRREGESQAPAQANGRAYCVACGVAVSEKVRDYCLARPQRFGGQIYCFKHQRRPHAEAAPSLD
jgi:restriction system protein